MQSPEHMRSARKSATEKKPLPTTIQVGTVFFDFIIPHTSQESSHKACCSIRRQLLARDEFPVGITSDFDNPSDCQRQFLWLLSLIHSALAPESRTKLPHLTSSDRSIAEKSERLIPPGSKACAVIDLALKSASVKTLITSA